MEHHLHQGRRKGRRTVILVLFTFVFFPMLACLPAAGLSQSGTAQLTQDAARWPFLRLVAVLFAGLVISTARLAYKFRRFWGLGVFTNFYAVLFLIFGVGLCGIPATSETALRSSLGSPLGAAWIADLSGIIVTLVLTAIRLKPQARPAEDSQVRDLDDGSGSNHIIAVIEDAIRDRILERMQLEVVAASHRYNWDAIRLAARRAMEEERTIGRLGREDYETALQKIKTFQADADSHLDSENKYNALVCLVGWCSFKRLRRGLDAAATKTPA